MDTKPVFVVYSKNGCPWCVKINGLLSQIETIKHVEYKLHENFTPEEFYDEFGQGSTFPQVVMNGKHLGGCVDTAKYLKENNIV